MTPRPNVVAVVQARLGSTRLPAKVLREVAGRPLLSYMLERVAAASSVSKTVLATTDSAQDQALADFGVRAGVAVFRGSEGDVLDRYYRCAQAHAAEVVVRLTSDCPLMDPAVIDEVAGVFLGGGYDYVANTAPPVGTYPDGMDVEVFSMRALERAWREAVKPSEREHVTFYFWKNPDLFKTRRHDLPENLSRFRLTVDYPSDLEVVSAVLAALYPGNPRFTMRDVLDWLSRNPEVRALNERIGWNQGWQAALEKDPRQP